MKAEKLIWIPRIITILFILFLSLFALDAFSGDSPLLQKLTGFLIHMIPSLILAVTLIFTWKIPVAGGCILLLTGLLFTFAFHTYRSFSTFMLISFPLAVAGILFIVFELVARKKR